MKYWQTFLPRFRQKVVGQCKCISKNWRSLIKDPSFVDLHHTRAKSRPDGCYLFISLCDHEYTNINFFSADLDGGSAQQLLTQSLSTEYLYNLTQFVNGLICLYYVYVRSIFILNPTTREIVNLPPSGLNSTFSWFFNLSFGFDPSTKEYKVLIIYHDPKEHFDYQCEIFTLGTHSWRKIDAVPPLSEFGYSKCCLNGVIYWRNKKDFTRPTPPDDFIMAFDLKEERFWLIPLPSGPSCMSHLIELGGHLVLSTEGPPIMDVEELWILQDYDNWIWVKESIIMPDWDEEDSEFPRGLFTNGTIQTGEILLSHADLWLLRNLPVFYYDWDRKSFRTVRITGLIDSDFVDDFRE